MCYALGRDDSPAGAALTAEGLLGVGRDELARLKVPKEVRFITAAELPTTATGKVLKFRLVTERVGEP